MRGGGEARSLRARRADADRALINPIPSRGFFAGLDVARSRVRARSGHCALWLVRKLQADTDQPANAIAGEGDRDAPIAGVGLENNGADHALRQQKLARSRAF
jgi:hypothetical protein